MSFPKLRFIITLISLTVLTWFLAACSSSSGDESAGDPTATPPAEAAATSTPAPPSTPAAESPLGPLPQPEGAEVILQDQTGQLLYFVSGEVASTVKFVRQELAALGWQEYRPPHSQQANDPEHVPLTFKKEGQGLSAYISTVADQPGKVSVQYSPIELALDLPAPADAADIEFSDAQIYLGFSSSASPETVAAYYRQALPEQGWAEMTDLSQVEAEQATLFFTNDKAQLVVHLSVTQSDGQSKVVLEAASAEAVAALSEPSEVEDEAEAEPTPTAETTADAGAAGALSDIPVPDGAQNVQYEPDLGQITYTSSEDIATLADFYREELPAQGWVEEEIVAMVQDTLGSLQFNQGEASLSLTIFKLGNETDVTISVDGLAMAGSDSGTDETEPAPADGPSFTINDWPVPDEAANVQQSGDELSYTVPWDLQTLADFYRPTLELMELSTSCLDDIGDFTSISCSTSNGVLSLNLFIFETGDNQSEVEISFTNSANAGDAPVSDDSAGLTAEMQDGLPVPDNHTSLSSEGSQYSRSMIAIIPAPLIEVLDFYQRELPPLNWEEQSGATEISDSQAHLSLTQGESALVVNLSSTGEDETEVTLTLKDTAAAKAAGVLPAAGQSRIYFGNLSEEAITFEIEGQETKVEPQAPGDDSMAGVPYVELPPGEYTYTLTVPGSAPLEDKITVGPDEVWGLIGGGPGGAWPVQIY
jgi:hypothetical protein